jgi:hypothetical protein
MQTPTDYMQTKYTLLQNLTACTLNTDLLAIVRVQLRFPQAVEHENQGDEQLCHVVGVHNGLTTGLFLGSQLFVDILQPLQDILVAQRTQGNMLNEGRVAEVEQTGLQALYQRPWLELDLFPMFPEFDNCALRGQHAVAVLVAVHWVLEALPKVQT